MRILLCGWPRTGKTTSAAAVARATSATVRSTDDLIPLGWSEASEHAAAWFAEPGPWIVEGVAVARAARKWLATNPGAAPPWDRFVVLTERHGDLTAGQTRMGKGIDTVVAELCCRCPIEWSSADGFLASVGIA